MSNGVKAVVAVAVLAVVGIGAFLLLRGDSGGGGADTPEQTVRSFFAAAEDHDCERLLSLVSRASWSEDGTVSRDEALDECRASVSEDDFFPAGTTIDKVELTVRDGRDATVKVTSTVEGRQVTETIPLVKEDGRWVIDFTGLDGSTSTSSSDLGD
jgi:hypothetical protein